MQQIRYSYLFVTVFAHPERQAILQTLQRDPWKSGEGTAPVLSMVALEKMHLPPVARYSLRRAGVCIYGYNPHLTWLLKEIGGSALAWWGWPEIGIALLAASWSHQRASDDPGLCAVMHHLFGFPLTTLRGTSLAPLTFPFLVPGADMEHRLS